MPPAPHVLYEDNHCLALCKPAGLLTQGVPGGVLTLEGFARDYLREKYAKKGYVYLGIPHRLDRPVSGVVLFARSSKAAARLAEQFALRQVTKVYWALVERSLRGDLPPPEGTWEDHLLKLPEQSRSEVTSSETPGAKHALLAYRVLRSSSDEALLEITPHTGRMHQIRVQASSRGWPIRGDEAYGARTSFGPPAEQARDRLVALHGRSLTFLHPIRYEPITLTAPPGEGWGGVEIDLSTHAQNTHNTQN